MLLGCGHGDTHESGEDATESVGMEIDVKTGDVVVLPAGTGHACLESSTSDDVDGEYRYIGVYPQVSCIISDKALRSLRWMIARRLAKGLMDRG